MVKRLINMCQKVKRPIFQNRENKQVSVYMRHVFNVSESINYYVIQEGIVVGRTFAALKNYQVDGNKEMIAIGLMNVVGSTTSCYVTTGILRVISCRAIWIWSLLQRNELSLRVLNSNRTSNYISGAFSRSAVNHNAGAKSAVSNIVMSVTVMVTLLFLMPLFRYTPNVVLGAIIVTAVIGLIDLPAAYQIWKIDKFDFIVMLCAFLGVILISVQEGLAIAVSSFTTYLYLIKFCHFRRIRSLMIFIWYSTEISWWLPGRNICIKGALADHKT